MPFESYTALLRDAQERRYAVGAFNIFALEFLPAILEAAEEQRSPALLQINPVHFHLSDLPRYLEYVKSQIARASVPIGLNLDHGFSREIITQGIQAGFPSVMFDGSKLDYDENVAATTEIVQLCREHGVTVEAELGALNDEGAELTEEVCARLFTDPDKAAEFIALTGVDGLAVAIGNAHGFYKGEPKLDFDRLRAIRERVKVPLVLHGGSGISDADFIKAIERGICKINIYTEMSARAWSTVRGAVSKNDAAVDYPTLLQGARSSVKEVVSRRMRVFGSSGRG